MDILNAVVELIKKAATDLPADVEDALRAAARKESEAIARSTLSVALDNVRIAREEKRPICQDTGVPVFFATAARGTSHAGMTEILREAVRIATHDTPLRPNAVDPLTGRNTGDGVGEGFPVIYCGEWQQDYHLIQLLLKGGGSENIGALYKLPDSGLCAERDIAGVRLAILDAVFRAQGRGCPPYVVGVGVGATKDDAAVLAKRQLLRQMDDRNDNDVLDALEQQTLEEINTLEIGPSGLSGNTTAIGVKVAAHARHPATFFVDVSFGCWAHRRRSLRFREGHAIYE